jgi:peptidoglycan/xylan/chitin deacetylase (PgdA/CDA1 family)
MLGLKIDVDTYWGMKNGVPSLLQTLKQFNLKGTFFRPRGITANQKSAILKENDADKRAGSLRLEDRVIRHFASRAHDCSFLS